MAAKKKAASRKVARVMHEWKQGTLKSGGSGEKVKSRKQAIAIGLSEARKSGAKVPRKKGQRPAARGRARARRRPAWQPKERCNYFKQRVGPRGFTHRR